MTSINSNRPGALFFILPKEPIDDLTGAGTPPPPLGAPGTPGRPVDQFVGSGKAAPVALSTPPNGVDVGNYSAATRKKLDVSNDGTLDGKELDAARRFADVNGDGIVGLGEQRALDYVLGHDTSDFAKKTFESLHGGEPGGLARRASESNQAEQGAAQKYDRLNKKLDQVSIGYQRTEQDMRDVMAKQGIPISPDSAKVLDQRLAKMDPADPQRPVVEFQRAYATMKERHDTELVGLNQEKLDARAQLETAKVVNRGAQALYAAAGPMLK